MFFTPHFGIKLVLPTSNYQAILGELRPKIKPLVLKRRID